ncbi:class I SAM-dependent methyltransferase, partial [Acinetobacter baumannii]|nr:class I SAM-dependent methyltransferase [Acinetobacter baumannii]
SNSATQKMHILLQAELRGLTNVEVLTCDVNILDLDQDKFDRVVSVEMFEHVRNYQRLFEKIQGWLKADGLLWCHIFCHRFLHYPFEVKSDYDWMSKYFFTGGLMPSTSTFLHFQEHLELTQQWQWSGEHYMRTANAWLDNMDNQEVELKPLFKKIYGKDANIWWQRWRIFFMACAELFGFEQGQEWVIGHFLFKKRS